MATVASRVGGDVNLASFILWMQRAENLACRVADSVVSILPKTDQHLVEHGMLPEKFVYIPNGIDPEEWNDENKSEIPTLHQQIIVSASEQNHMLVVYAGSHGIANSLDTLLDAASLARDLPVSLVTGGEWTRESQISSAGA